MLTTITVLYTRSPELIQFWKIVLFDPNLCIVPPHPTPVSSDHHSVSVNSAFFLDSTYNYVVTKSKLILIFAQLVNKSRDKLLGQGAVTLFRKPADQEHGGLVSQSTVFPGFGC